MRLFDAMPPYLTYQAPLSLIIFHKMVFAIGIRQFHTTLVSAEKNGLQKLIPPRLKTIWNQMLVETKGAGNGPERFEMIRQKYKALTADEIQKYKNKLQEQFDAEKKLFMETLRSFTPTEIDSENRRRSKEAHSTGSRYYRLRHPDVPKKPSSAFILFYKELRNNPKLRQELGIPEAISTLVEETQNASKAWKELAEDKKKPFIDKSKALKEQYDKFMKEAGFR